MFQKTQYCWICHSTLQNGETRYSKPCCPRVYHMKCLKGNKSDLNCYTCPECQLETVDGTPPAKPVPPKKLQLLLSAIMSRRRKEESFKNPEVFDHWPRSIENDIVNIMDFEILDKKIKGSAYSKASEFFSDTKWILHNCFITYGSISDVTSDAKQLLKSFKADLLDMEACFECFYYGISHIENSFIRVCNPPHAIIWAKMNRCPSWPAKLLKTNNGSVYVKFFKTHDIGKDIPISRCHFISKEHPNGVCPQRVVPAVEELKEYVISFEKLRGVNSFQYYDKGTSLTGIKVSKKVQQVSTSRPNVTKGSYTEQPQSSSTSQNAFSVNMTFSEEQITSPAGPPNLIESANRSSSGIDIQSFTTTKVITSTPVVATSSDIPSDDLTLGADFSNSFSPELNNMSDSSDIPFSSQHSSRLSSNRAYPSASASGPSHAMPGPSTSRNSNVTDDDWQQSLFRLLGNVVNSEISNDSSAMMPYTQNNGRFALDEDNVASYMFSYLLLMWNIVKCLPSSSHIIASTYKELQRFQRFADSLKKENSELKLVCNDLRRAVSKLQCELAEVTNKNKQLDKDFGDATKNARKIVQSIAVEAKEAEQICKSKLDAQKEEYEKKLRERDALIEDCENHLKTMKCDNDALKIKCMELKKLIKESHSVSLIEEDTAINYELSTNKLEEKNVSVITEENMFSEAIKENFASSSPWRAKKDFISMQNIHVHLKPLVRVLSPDVVIKTKA